MMQIKFHTIEGQQPNSEWGLRQEQISGKFRMLRNRAFGASAETSPEAVITDPP